MKVHFSSMSVDWATPKEVYKKLDEEFSFNFDPCPLGGGGVHEWFRNGMGKLDLL